MHLVLFSIEDGGDVVDDGDVIQEILIELPIITRGLKCYFVLM